MLLSNPLGKFVKSAYIVKGTMALGSWSCHEMVNLSDNKVLLSQPETNAKDLQLL